MNEHVDVLKILQNEGLAVLGTVIRDSGSGDHCFIYIPVERNAEGHQVPSNRSLHRARGLLKEQGFNVDFILSDAHSQDIEAGVRATLLHAYGDELRNVFLSIENTSAIVWIEQKKTIEASVKTAIAKKAAVFLHEVGLTLNSLLLTVDEKLPGKLAFLNVIRQVAPAEMSSIKKEFLNRGFSVLSDDWLNRKLDALRKTEAIVRLATGQYVLSSRTLDVLGTVRAGRSPDVSRLLALAQKYR